MEKVKEKDNALKNIFYALSTCWKISKLRVICTLLEELLGNGIWLFTGSFYIRILIDKIQGGKEFSQIAVFVIISALILILVELFFVWFNGKVIPVTDTLVYEKLYAKIYEKARNVELHCYEDSQFYNKYTMAIDGAGDKMIQTMSHAFGILSGVGATIVSSFVLFSIDPNAIVFLIGPLVGNFLFGRWLNHTINRRYQDNVKNERTAEYVNRVMYLADYAKELRLSQVFRIIMKKYKLSIADTGKIVDGYSTKTISLHFSKDIMIFTIVYEGVMLYSAYHTLVTGRISLASLAVIFSVMSTITWSLIGVFKSAGELHKNGLWLSYLRGFLQYEPEIPEDWDGEIPSSEISSIEFKNVSFCYKTDKPVIHHLSFTIHNKEHIALVGHNGAGKSTIIKLLFRLYDPTEGEILVNGKNIKQYNLKAYRKLFAAAFQDYKVFAMSVRDNVLMGRGGTDVQVIEALKKTDIYDKISALPKGIDTMLTREFDSEGAVLSGGQFQKIVVARAFAQDTPIKVFDEPSSALDPIGEYNLYSSIMNDTKEKTLLFISHRLSSVQDANRVYMLENGTILEEGTHEESLTKNGAYADMYYKQAKNYLASDETEMSI